MKPLGEVQRSVLGCLITHRKYPGGWLWDNHSNTKRIMATLVKRGLAEKTNSYTYVPTQAGIDLIRGDK